MKLKIKVESFFQFYAIYDPIQILNTPTYIAYK